MDARDTAQQLIGEVESLTGRPVRVTRDATIKQMAVLEMARGPTLYHSIRIHPGYDAQSTYLICLECGFILRKFALPPDRRVDFVANPKGRREVERLVRDHYSQRKLPGDVLAGLSAQLYDGLMLQLISTPLSLRVDSWIADEFPGLADQQRVMITRQLQDALRSLHPETRKVAPDRVVKASLKINAAYAMHWSRRWGDDLISLPYRSANLTVAAGRLLDLHDDTPTDPQHDADLIKAWANELGLADISTCRPHLLD